MRHCLTEWNLQNRIMGQHDIDLSNLGRTKKQTLRPIICTHVIDSRLNRAQETIEIVTHLIT